MSPTVVRIWKVVGCLRAVQAHSRLHALSSGGVNLPGPSVRVRDMFISLLGRSGHTCGIDDVMFREIVKVIAADLARRGGFLSEASLLKLERRLRTDG